MRRLHQSLIFRAGITMAGVTLLAIASMVAALVVADIARQDAAAVNLAGSLRMQSYRLGSTISQQPAQPMQVRQQMLGFEARLNDPLLTSHVEANVDSAAPMFARVREHWASSMRPALERHATDPAQARVDYLSELESFVAEVDQLVSLIQREAEERLAVLRLIQGTALFLTLGLVFVAMYKLLTDVVPPLRELFRAVEQARSGDFSLRPQYRGQDEIGLLSQTYNLMAEDLGRLYADLEQRVAKKTAALTRSNEALKVLYDTSRQLSRESLETEDYRRILNKVAQVIGIGPITLCLTTENADRAYRRITSANGAQPDFCHSPNCGPCLKSPGLPDLHSPRPGMLSIPVKEADRQYGVVLIQHTAEQMPQAWQIELVEAVAAQIAASMGLARQRDQQHRLALMDERAVIARELHDSLAQSLSYLKIQVARLQTLAARSEEAPGLEEVIAELKEGLNSAYRQLRELLTTFRLKMNEPGLEPALEQTVAEFAQRGDLHIALDYRLAHCPLTPNEEVHVLQVVREALANIIHHAQADDAEVHLETTDDGRVKVSVLDNGVGIPENWQRRNHYGMTIMRERAESLNGALEFARRPEGGTRVELSFSPEAGTLPPTPAPKLVAAR